MSDTVEVLKLTAKIIGVVEYQGMMILSFDDGTHMAWDLDTDHLEMTRVDDGTPLLRSSVPKK
ncbi:hypothetical protein JCM17380_24690 [Desulfosporosinus burensis]